MAMGFDDCFVADISCEIPLNPTIDGKAYPPLFNRKEVERMMKSNPYRALREYYNLFDQMGGTDLVVTRENVLRNEETYLPIFENKRDDVLYGIFYDPALQADNAFVLITEYFRDPEKGWKMRLINGINLLQTLPNGDKKPMRSTEQLEVIHKLMLAYNGKNDEYKKIHNLSEISGIEVKTNKTEYANVTTVDILNELGQRWQTLSKAEQVALAQTVGGTRQYTQLIALMEN